MSPRSRFLLATACGLVLAGIAHIVAVLSIPHFAASDALAMAKASESLDHPLLVHSLASGTRRRAESPWLPIPDPAVAVGVCAYDLDDGPMRLSARTGPLTLSVAMHGKRGAFYAVTDQAALRGALELVVMTRAQYDEALANEDENEVSRDVRIIASEHEGFAIVRVVAGLPSQRAMADAAVEGVSCSIDAPEEPAAEAKSGG